MEKRRTVEVQGRMLEVWESGDCQWHAKLAKPISNTVNESVLIRIDKHSTAGAVYTLLSDQGEINGGFVEIEEALPAIYQMLTRKRPDPDAIAKLCDATNKWMDAG